MRQTSIRYKIELIQRPSEAVGGGLR